MITSTFQQSAIRFALATLFATSTSTSAAGEAWIHAGPASIRFHDHTTLSAQGTVISGAGARASNNTAAMVEYGYRLTPQWSASVTAGVPPTSKLTATGSAARLGTAGDITYGPLVLNLQYWLGGFSGVRPYVGAGAAYYIVFKSRDGAIRQLDVRNGWGSALQLGVEVPLSLNWSLFVDVKKLFLKIEATGVLPALGGAAVEAKATLNPVGIHAGVSYSY